MPVPRVVTAGAVIFLLMCGQPLPPLEIKGGTPEQQSETLKAVKFYVDHRGLDWFDFTDGLVLELREEPWWYQRTLVAGLYFDLSQGRSTILVAWLGGPKYNALFHELLHHEVDLFESGSGLTYKDSFNHSQKFLDAVAEIKQAYQ